MDKQVNSYQELIKFLKEVDAKFILDTIDPRVDDVDSAAILKYAPVIEGSV